MLKYIILSLTALMLVSCTSTSKLVQYEKDINDIRDEVRTIRKMTDEMKNQLGEMRSSMERVDASVKQQTEDIEEQNRYHTRLKSIVGSIKDAVVNLESEKLPAKKEELENIKNENRDDATPMSGFVLKTEQDGAVTKIYTEKLPDVTPPVKPKKRANIKSEAVSGFGYAVKDGVILWQYPTRKSDVLEILVSWQQLRLLEKVDNSGLNWWKVKTNDYTGYVNSKFIIVSDK